MNVKRIALLFIAFVGSTFTCNKKQKCIDFYSKKASVVALLEDAARAAGEGKLSASATSLQAAANLLELVATDLSDLPVTAGRVRVAAARFGSAAKLATQSNGLGEATADLNAAIEYMESATASAQEEGFGKICQP